jgi:hypothetical protein
VRRADFWERLELVLDPGYVQSWARDTHLAELGMSVVAAFEAGVETRVVWDAVCQSLEIPAHLQ